MSSEKGKTLLLVEDECLIAMAEKMALEKCGYVVITTNSGEKAVKAVKEHKGIDLILMDINLGEGMDGIATAKTILNYRGIPIVFVSSCIATELFEKTEMISPYGYVAKNSGTPILDASIKMAFKLFEAKEKIKTIDSELETMLDIFPAMLFEAGLDGRFYDYHFPFSGLVCDSASEFIGKKIPEVLPSGIATVVMSSIMEAHGRGASVGRQFETPLRGVARLYELSVMRKVTYPIEPHFIVLISDISERKHVEEALAASESRYRRLFEAARDGILILDVKTGRVLDANPFLVELLGYPKELLIEKTIWEIDSFMDLVTGENRFGELRRKKNMEPDEVRLKTADGDIVDVEFLSDVYPAGKREVMQCIIRKVAEGPR
jgi:PAS domain S-box-containing protein